MKKALVAIAVATLILVILQIRPDKDRDGAPSRDAAEPITSTAPHVLEWRYVYVDPETDRIEWKMEARKAIPLDHLDPFQANLKRRIEVEAPILTIIRPPRLEPAGSPEGDPPGPLVVSAPRAECVLLPENRAEVHMTEGIRLEGDGLLLTTDSLDAWLNERSKTGKRSRMATDRRVSYWTTTVPVIERWMLQ